jgi:hypothetical protein
MPAPIIEFVDVNVLVGGVSVDKFSFGTLLGVFAHTVNADRQNGPFFSMAEVNAAGFTVGAEPEANAWATAVFSQDDGVDQILIGLLAVADAGSYTTALDAIEAAGPNDWYITNIESRLDADLITTAAWTETRSKIFLGQSDDLAVAEFIAWQGLGYNRSAGWYHAADAEYLDGAESSSGGGLNLDAPDGAGIWAYRQLEGVPFDAVTGAQALAIYAANANLFGRNKGVNFTSKGTMASGRFIDVTTSIDWTVARMEEAILALFVGTPTKIPYTNAGINIIVATVQDVLNRGVTAGHFSTDVDPTVVAPDVSTVSGQDKIDRLLTLTANVVLAGAIQKVILNINLTF